MLSLPLNLTTMPQNLLCLILFDFQMLDLFSYLNAIQFCSSIFRPLCNLINHLNIHFIMYLNLFCYLRLWDLLTLSYVWFFPTCQDREFFPVCLYWTMFFMFFFEGRVLLVCLFLFILHFLLKCLVQRVHTHCSFWLMFLKAMNEFAFFISQKSHN